MIMEFKRVDNNELVFVNMDLVTDFYSEAKGTRIRYHSGGGILVVGDAARIYQNYSNQKMSYR